MVSVLFSGTFLFYLCRRPFVTAYAAPPLATGKVDDTVNALLQDSENEIIASQEENNEASVIIEDYQTISDFKTAMEKARVDLKAAFPKE